MKQPYSFGGVEYPSVTTIIGILDKGSALMNWAVGCGLNYVRDNMTDETDLETVLNDARVRWQDAREEAADIGTEIHDLIHKYIKYGKDAAGEMRPEVENGFLAFLDWEKANNVQWVLTEVPVHSAIHGFAGTLDAICIFGGKKYLIDFKSSKGFYDGYDMQLAAYQVAASEMGHQTEGCGILRLDKVTGLPEWKDYTDKQEQAKAAFLALVKFYYLQKNRRLKNNPFILKPTKANNKEIEVLI